MDIKIMIDQPNDNVVRCYKKYWLTFTRYKSVLK